MSKVYEGSSRSGDYPYCPFPSCRRSYDKFYYTLLNILSGFKKCGIHPLNPGEVKDRQLAPAKAVRPDQQQLTPTDAPEKADASQTKNWSPETVALYQLRFEEGYDLEGLDVDYTEWLKSEHPSAGKSISQADSVLSSASGNTPSNSDVLSDILVYPKPSQKSSSRKRKPAINSRAVCITEESVLEKLKEADEEKVRQVAEKENRKLANEQKKVTALEKKARIIAEKEKRKLEREQKKIAAMEEKSRKDAEKEKRGLRKRSERW